MGSSGMPNVFSEIMQMEDNGAPSMADVMRVLASEAVPNLPPGGGLASK